MGDTQDASALGKCVLDTEAPLAKRMRSIFHLRTLGTEEASQLLCDGLRDQRNSALMRHELAYVLGQVGRRSAVPTLEAVLRDEGDDVIVRHECAEAIGAIGDQAGLAVLRKYESDPAKEVSETCALAVERLQWQQSEEGRSQPREGEGNPFHSVDPAPAEKQTASVAELRAQLLDGSRPLFDRYRAMFSLRNRGGEEAAAALADGLRDPDSALFRHEVAYVLGQMQEESVADSLVASLTDEGEHPMVRHEAAEALGAIGTEACMAVLRRYASDESRVVRESCEVALDAIEYWDGQQQEGEGEVVGVAA